LAVVAVLITAAEALAKVVVVVASVQVVTVIAVVGILIGIRASVIGAPSIFAVCLTGPEAFLIAVVQGLAEQVSAVLINFVVAAIATVTINRSRIEIRITVIIRVTVGLEKLLLLTQAP